MFQIQMSIRNVIEGKLTARFYTNGWPQFTTAVCQVLFPRLSEVRALATIVTSFPGFVHGLGMRLVLYRVCTYGSTQGQAVTMGQPSMYNHYHGDVNIKSNVCQVLFPRLFEVRALATIVTSFPGFVHGLGMKLVLYRVCTYGSTQGQAVTMGQPSMYNHYHGDVNINSNVCQVLFPRLSEVRALATIGTHNDIRAEGRERTCNDHAKGNFLPL